MGMDGVHHENAVDGSRPLRTSTPPWIWAGRLASALTIMAAWILASAQVQPMRLLFLIWTCANVLWIWYGWRLRSWPLVAAQVVFLSIDLVGIVHYWILGDTQWARLFY